MEAEQRGKEKGRMGVGMLGRDPYLHGVIDGNKESVLSWCNYTSPTGCV